MHIGTRDATKEKERASIKRKLYEIERLTGLLWERAALSESLLSGIASTRL